MRICFCLGKLSYSGAENVARFLMESFIEHGHQVGVLLLNELPKKNEIIDRLELLDGVVSETGIRGIVRRINKERTEIKRFRPDIFIIFNCEMAFSAIPAAYGLVKTVVCERNDPTMIPPSKNRRFLRDLLYRFASAGVYQTKDISEYFNSITKRRYIINNPIREKRIKCQPCSNRRKVFVTVARLDDHQKNQSMMIKAFAEVIKIHPEYELHMLGEGPDREKYENLISEYNLSDNIKMLGNNSNPVDYISTCRAFLLTSHYEGMPNALIEAMSVGLPCISTDCNGGGAAAIIRNYENGILIPDNNISKLVEKILELIEDEELCEKIGGNAYNLNQELAGEKIYDLWEKMALEVIGKIHNQGGK